MFFDHLPQKGLIYGHRGARSITPENTLLAMRKAREWGAHCWETDIRMSSDGELVIFHDETLERTTNVSTHPDFMERADYHLDRFTLDELRMLDCGSWFLADDPYGTVTSGEVGAGKYGEIREQKIPLLSEILNYSKTHTFPVNLEIKDLKHPSGDVVVVDRILDMIRATDTMDLVLLSSFRHDYLHRARALDKDIAIAVLVKGEHPPNLISYLKSFSAVAYHPGKEIFDPDLITQLSAAGIRVNSWTVNDLGRAREMLGRGAGVITDWPQRLA